MKQGYLSQYFEGVAIKRLSAVEADVIRSNQHEFNGVMELRALLGEPEGKVRFAATYLYFTDEDHEPVIEDGLLTWYDARRPAREKRGVMRWEYRLYFEGNAVTESASEGDLLVIARRPGNTLLAIVASRGSTAERQLLWLFSAGDPARPGFLIRLEPELEAQQGQIGFAARTVLEQIGVATEEEDESYLEEMLSRFGGAFPKTQDFSAYARNTCRGIDSRDGPDAALLAWMEREELLYRTLEKHLLGEKLGQLVRDGRIDDVEPVVKLVQSTLQRRKSRAGSALENHLEQIFADWRVTRSRTSVTELNVRPDFVFPGISQYHETAFPQARLTMLAVKSTCKDRWRQILNEAARIPHKHLLTLEPGISENQTHEMQAEKVQLVLPGELHATYTPPQQSWLMDVASFLHLVKQRQK